MNLWNIAWEKKSLWIKLVHSKYLEGLTVWSILARPKDSWGWKRLLAKRGTILKHISFSVGNGESFRLWRDPWVNGDFLADLAGECTILALGKGNSCSIKETI